ncbi:hypothetical protein M405DRAFT_751470, partial [Rhizopogon salebrosus TDB-379]
FTTLATIALVDFIIASSLCYIFATSRTGFSSMDSFLTKLMVYTINTGCLTSICSMTAIITCAVMPRTFIYMAVEFLVAKLYVNSFLALMNARYYLQPNTDTTWRLSPRAAIRDSEDDKMRASRKSVFTHPHDDGLHPSRPAQAATACGFVC